MIQIQKVVYYTGEEQQVQVLVYLNGNLVPETEYEIAEGSQISGTEPGTYTVTINGLSPNFTGSVNVQWRIIDTWSSPAARKILAGSFPSGYSTPSR